MNNLSNITGILNELNLAIEGSTLNELNRADIKELIDNLLVVIVDRFELQESDTKGSKDDEDDSSGERPVELMPTDQPL